MNAIPQFDTLFKQVTNALPKGFSNLHQDLEKNLRVALDSSLRKMNLVTREEFEVQTAVLERTRSRLEALEKQVAALDKAKSADNSSFNPEEAE
jgi:BMFP domain-containing protein YqiC